MKSSSMNNFKGYLIVREILKKQDLINLYKYTIQDLEQIVCSLS